MSADDRPIQPAAPKVSDASGYRTLVPGKGAVSAKPPAEAKAPPTAAKDAPAKPSAAKPEPPKPNAAKPEPEKPHDDPTRFGDWEIKGRCIDF